MVYFFGLLMLYKLTILSTIFNINHDKTIFCEFTMIVVRTPLRLSFVGGGSDMKGFYEKKDGMVVSTAIDKFVYAIVKERFDDMIFINYSQKECVNHVSGIICKLCVDKLKKPRFSRGFLLFEGKVGIRVLGGEKISWGALGKKNFRI